MMQVTIDRFEGEWAVVEISAHRFAKISKELLPQAVEGDVIEITVNTQETSRRRDAVDAMLADLFED